MDLQFGKLEIEGFKTFLDKQTLDFAAYPPGLHFIRGHNKASKRLGSNGAAKSSIFHAMEWLLFGSTVNNLKNPDIKPWHGKVKTRVAQTITIDGKPRLFQRTIDPNLLTLDGEAIGNERVVQEIGLSHEVFNHTIMLGQGEALFLDLQPRHKMQLISDVLDLERWTARSKKASAVVQQLEQDKASIEGEQIGNATTVSQLVVLLKNSKALAQDWAADHEQKRSQLKAELKELQTQLATAVTARDSADLAYDEAMTELKQLDRDIQTRRDTLAAAQRAYDQERINLDGLRKNYEALGTADTCPLCKQSIKGTDLAAHKVKLKQLIDRGVPKPLSKELKEAELALQATRVQREQYAGKCDTTEAELNRRKPVVTQLETRIAELTKQLTEQASEHNPHMEQVRALNRRLEETKAHHDALSNELMEIEARMVRTSFWVKGFKDVQLMIMEDLLHEIGLVSNSILAEIGLDDWALQYAIEKETKSGSVQRGLQVTVLSPDNKKPVRWECWSGGERQRLRIVGTMALSEVLLNHAGVRPSMMAIDEPTRDLSDEGVEDLCQCLSEQAKETDRAIFLIDHKTELSSAFATTIDVVKGADGTSRILVA